ncbi:MAG: inositol monophosphatase family protein [Thermoleophilia bacterium]
MTNPPTHLLGVAVRAARAAAAELLPRFGGPAHGVDTKSTSTDMVSDADRAAERAIMDVLAAERPHDGVLGEEGTSHEGTTGVRWIVDPLDGTTNFLWGIPQWAVSVAAHDADGPLVGVVLDACREECFTAARGHGAWLGERRLHVNRPAGLDQALIGTGFNYRPDERARQAARLCEVMPRVRDIRRGGAAALDMAWLAAGRLDGFLERGVEVWDWAAGLALVQEAGGAWQVLDPTAERPGGVAAAHPDLLGPLIDLFEVTGGE